MAAGLPRKKACFPGHSCHAATMKSLPVFLSTLLALSGAAPAAEPSLIADGAKVEVLSEGYLFTEGPAVDRDGNVFFTDQPNDRIVK